MVLSSAIPVKEHSRTGLWDLARRRALSLLGVLLVGILTGCGAGDLGVLHPDTILFNGKIVTVDADFSIAEAVAIAITVDVPVARHG